MYETIHDDRMDGQGRLGDVLALVVRDRPYPPGVNFLSDPDDLLQVGLIRHPGDTTVRPHEHPKRYVRARRAVPTEVLYVKSGTMVVTVYSADRLFTRTFEVAAGEFVVLLGGGHGFFFPVDTEILEVRGGPYDPESDKVRF